VFRTTAVAYCTALQSARLRAIARATGEARAGTVLPSTAAADNYMDSLKAQTRK
jgi:hypothetical protein